MKQLATKWGIKMAFAAVLLAMGIVPSFAVDAAITVPSLGVDWPATTTAVTTAINPGIVSIYGLGIALLILGAVFSRMRKVVH